MHATGYRLVGMVNGSVIMEFDEYRAQEQEKFAAAMATAPAPEPAELRQEPEPAGPAGEPR